MTDDSPELVCKFTTEIETQGDSHVVTLPDTEIDYGTLSAGDVVRISVERVDAAGTPSSHADASEPSPPVNEGDQLTVEIEDLGDQGDGIARVDRGYVLIVPGTEPGETVDVEVAETNPNYGFAQPVDAPRQEPAEMEF